MAPWENNRTLTKNEENDLQRYLEGGRVGKSGTCLAWGGE